MKIGKRQWLGITFGIAIAIGNYFAFFAVKRALFYFIIAIAALVAILPFLISAMVEVGREKEKEEMFLEFARSLVENVKSGMPISRAIISLRDKDFGSLTPHIQKLANQITLGISVRMAFETFAKDIGNKIISRSVTLIGEAEKAGGQIDTILESVSKSVSEIEDLKKEQKTATYNLVIQGYIIFLVFIIIMLITELKIIPMTTGLPGMGAVFGGGLGGALGGKVALGTPTEKLSPEQLAAPFLILLVIQGFFAGLVIGKLSEGSIKAGLKHSVILAFLALFITTGVKALFA